ncbi:MAG: mammalian cell entry protein [Mycobacterium sp.]|uniref:mammalian cell entry protein n=1 Tax=Mycobacterium sp. TaxID=1785 RepID=UPI000CC7123D|nr:mammalian cell entry protein [Mycobacterium sp.]PJE11648.1 MAG: mammalian cell entry protein [Mycobacterium sp.]PJE13724.1 MAG: mammalian cell entry protein [Mycobacterium sp.]
MSPLRRIAPDERPLFVTTSPRRARHRGLALLAVPAGAVAAAAISVCAVVLNIHEAQRHTSIRDAEVLAYVRSFMTEFTSPDPFHANDYTDRVLAQATGEFAQEYRQNQNQILIEVARAEPTTGTVLEVGVSRWHDDGSVDVLVMTKFTTKSPDGKLQFERGNRWVVTARQEAERWRICRLTPTI